MLNSMHKMYSVVHVYPDVYCEEKMYCDNYVPNQYNFGCQKPMGMSHINTLFFILICSTSFIVHTFERDLCGKGIGNPSTTAPLPFISAPFYYIITTLLRHMNVIKLGSPFTGAPSISQDRETLPRGLGKTIYYIDTFPLQLIV